MHALASADLTVKPEKCTLLMRQVQYVGHVLCEGQRFPSPAKTEALRLWDKNTIKTAKALKGFLGLADWYSIYIENSAKYAAPLMDALKGKYLYEENGSTNSDGSGLPPRSVNAYTSPLSRLPLIGRPRWRRASMASKKHCSVKFLCIYPVSMHDDVFVLMHLIMPSAEYWSRSSRMASGILCLFFPKAPG